MNLQNEKNLFISLNFVAGIFFILLLTLCFSNHANATLSSDFIESPPLANVVKSPVQSCITSPSTTPVTVPLLTWGGDVATIFANGLQNETTPESIFAKHGLKYKLWLENRLTYQLEAYLACKTPFLRGTLGMLEMLSDITNQDPRSKMIMIHQLTWSSGGDALIVKENISTPAQLKGKTIALQAYGPHVYYLGQILKDAGLSFNDVKIRWTKDINTSEQSAPTAFKKPEIDAALVIIPDAMQLTANIKGSKILLSTKIANHLIADVYAVRSDYYKSHRAEVQKFVQGLMKAQEQLSLIIKEKSQQSAEYNKIIKASARLLLNQEQATKESDGMLNSVAFAGWAGNVKFFSNSNDATSFAHMTKEAQSIIKSAGLVKKGNGLKKANWDFSTLKKDLNITKANEEAGLNFSTEKISQVVSQRNSQNNNEGELFKFEIFFKPNQNSFNSAEYTKAFKRAIDLASKYGGAVISIEGHSDPLAYLKKKKESQDETILSRMRQSLKNLSLQRATSVRDSLLKYANTHGMKVDPNQFTVVGHGIDRPNTGICGADPCAPKTEQDWLSNMRVEFKLIQIESEQSVFESI